MAKSNKIGAFALTQRLKQNVFNFLMTKSPQLFAVTGTDQGSTLLVVSPTKTAVKELFGKCTVTKITGMTAVEAKASKKSVKKTSKKKTKV